MKAVLLSIKPKYCELIANGKKTLEIRKTKPKLKPPFKCLIYCTKPKHPHEDYITIEPQCSYEDFVSLDSGAKEAQACRGFYGGGKVIGEFICDRIEYLDMDSIGVGFYKNNKFIYIDDLGWNTGLSRGEFIYYTEGLRAYGWHITNLIIYDKPKELSEFGVLCPEFSKGSPICEGCRYENTLYNGLEPPEFDCKCDGFKALTRPPQSWCYIEEN